MATIEEVESFLRDFKLKMNIFQIIFRDARKKNTQALLDLEISPADRKKIISTIENTDYSEGPLNDTLYGINSMWVFGKKVKKTEVYVKISMGNTNNPVICISFHAAEKPMTYPFRK